jgi:DNA-binding transcriptional ArsR family regulator
MTQPFVVSSSQQLQVIASPGREEIVDAVALLGPCTITDLAGFLGRSRNSLYYHVRALRDCRLLLETHRAGEGKRATAYYETPGRPLSVRFDLSTEPRRQAVMALVRARLRLALKGFLRACRPGAATIDGPRRNLWATHLKGWLSEAELEEANALFARLIDLVGRPDRTADESRKPYEFSFVLAPIERPA